MIASSSLKLSKTLRNIICKGCHHFRMEPTQYEHRKIVVQYLEKIPTTIGWWYQIPVLNRSNSSRELDSCLPQLGTLFGLTEDAIAVVFVEMGLLKIKKTDLGISTVLLKNAWDNLAGEFNVKNLIEITPCQFKGFNRMWLIRLGYCVFSPGQIWNQKKKSPPKLVTRATSSFFLQQLISIFKKSQLFSTLLSIFYFSSLSLGRNKKKTNQIIQWKK